VQITYLSLHGYILNLSYILLEHKFSERRTACNGRKSQFKVETEYNLTQEMENLKKLTFGLVVSMFLNLILQPWFMARKHLS